MKAKLLLIVACAFSMLANAQLLEIQSVKKLPVSTGEEMKVAGFSPAGDYVLLTNDIDKGLVRYDLATGTQTQLTDALGAGWAVKISKDGKDIVYREMTIGEDKLVKHDILKMNVAKNEASVVAKAQRNMLNLVHANNANSVTINEDLHMVVVKNGKNIVLTPNGKEAAYNWASISPDGKSLLYYVSAKGCYVCDIDGNNVQLVARHCRAPQWYNNNIIIGMADEDDGKFMTASAIVAYDLQGNGQVLVNKENMANYPYDVEGKIAFSNAGGEVFLMQVK
jgi:Tol biopolymer transport system component